MMNQLSLADNYHNNGTKEQKMAQFKARAIKELI